MGCDAALTEALGALYEDDVVASVCDAGCSSLEACSLLAMPLALQALKASEETTIAGLNTAFLLFSAYLVFVM